MDDELPTCPVCEESFTNPHQLPCMHNVCRPCLPTLLGKTVVLLGEPEARMMPDSQSDRKKGLQNSSLKVECLECGATHLLTIAPGPRGMDVITSNNIKPNEPMKRLIEKFKLMNSEMEKSSAKLAEEQKQKEALEKELSLATGDMCEVHMAEKMVKNLYCSNCHNEICHLCHISGNKHKKHKVVPLALHKEFLQHQQVLHRGLGQLNRQLKLLDNQRKAMDTIKTQMPKRQSKFSTSVSKKIQAAISALQKYQKDVNKVISDHDKQLETRLEEEESSLKARHKDLVTTKKNLEEMLLRGYTKDLETVGEKVAILGSHSYPDLNKMIYIPDDMHPVLSRLEDFSTILTRTLPKFDLDEIQKPHCKLLEVTKEEPREDSPDLIVIEEPQSKVSAPVKRPASPTVLNKEPAKKAKVSTKKFALVIKRLTEKDIKDANKKILEEKSGRKTRNVAHKKTAPATRQIVTRSTPDDSSTSSEGVARRGRGRPRGRGRGRGRVPRIESSESNTTAADTYSDTSSCTDNTEIQSLSNTSFTELAINNQMATTVTSESMTIGQNSQYTSTSQASSVYMDVAGPPLDQLDSSFEANQQQQQQQPPQLLVPAAGHTVAVQYSGVYGGPLLANIPLGTLPQGQTAVMPAIVTAAPIQPALLPVQSVQPGPSATHAEQAAHPQALSTGPNPSLPTMIPVTPTRLIQHGTLVKAELKSASDKAEEEKSTISTIEKDFGIKIVENVEEQKKSKEDVEIDLTEDDEPEAEVSSSSKVVTPPVDVTSGDTKDKIITVKVKDTAPKPSSAKSNRPKKKKVPTATLR